MSSPTILDNLYQAYLSETQDSRSNKIEFIKKLNLLLWRMKLTKPAEMLSRIFYIDGFVNYKKPTDLRDAIGLYSDDGFPVIYYVSPQRFRWSDPENCFTDQGDNGKRYLRILFPGNESSVSQMTIADNLSSDGSWDISGGSDLVIDQTTKKVGSGSLSFTVSSALAEISFTKLSPIDITSMTEYMRSRLFVWFPGASYLPTSIKIKVGNDSGNYFYQEVSSQANGQDFKAGEANELEFALDEATEVGTVDKTAIDFYAVEYTFSAPINRSGFKVNNIVLAKPHELSLEYYTNYVAYNSAGELIQSITEDNNTTDEPIIKDYPDYVNTVLDGLCYDFFKIPDPQRAQNYYLRFMGEVKDSKIMGGMEYLAKQYPARQAIYKKMTNLPPINRGFGAGIYRRG